MTIIVAWNICRRKSKKYMDETLNKTCLQKPRQQTFGRNGEFPRPHMFIKAAPKDESACCIYNEEIKTPKESAASLRRWMKLEERAIDVKMNHMDSISQELRSA